MKHNGIGNFWKKSSENHYHRFSDDEIAFVKQTFFVQGEIRNIEGFPGYAVSNCGRVFSCVPCAWKKGDVFRELLPTCLPRKYKYVRLHVGKKEKRMLVHRIVALEFLPKAYPNQRMVRHLDGNPQNNYVSNLAWGTQKENMADCIRHGRTLRGAKNPSAKLTPEKVEEIKNLRKDGQSVANLAIRFGVCRETIRRAVNGEHWSYD